MLFPRTAAAALCAAALALFSCTVRCTTTRYFTYEEDAAGTEIGNLSRDLKIDPADDPHTSFRFMQESNSSLIRMREADGLLSVAEPMDRERLCPGGAPRCFVTFDVVAFSREKFHLIHVEIEVKDVNDHAPRFARNETRLEVLENVPVGSRFPLPPALDPDVGENHVRSYDISPSSHFAVEVRDAEEEEDGGGGGRLAELVLVRELDREVEDSYTVEVSAHDGGVPAKSGSMTVHIRVLDFNDNSPAFEHGSLKVELNEDCPVGHRVLRVHAFDPDEGANGEVVYALAAGTSPEAARGFHVDARTGDVTLRAQVDFERRRSYELRVQASDLGAHPATSTCTVAIEIVDVNDNAPEVSIKPMTSGSDDVAYITEAAAAESFVALVSTSDRDSGSNGYVRLSLLGHEHFALQQAYGDTFMIVTAATLDREKVAEYNLTVAAEDLGVPPFRTARHYTIRVTDENDNPPLFSKALYDVSVLENNIPGSYVTTVVARDPDVGKNAKVSYELVDSEGPDGAPLSSYVSVDPLSGSLYTLRSFDYEALRQLELVIQAEDGGSPSLSSRATIRIRVVDQNDNRPSFTFPVLQNESAEVPLPFNAPSGYLALRASAEDRDEGANGELSYRITRGDPSLFAVHKDTGEIALKRWLTAEIGEVLEVRLEVSDNGRAPLSSGATIRFVVSDTEPADDQAVIVLRPSEEEEEEGGGPVLDGSLVVIVLLGGGCALLLAAIAAVVATCRQGRAGKRAACRSLFDGAPVPVLEPNVYAGQRGSFFHERTSLSLDDGGGLYEDRSRDSETKMFLPSKHFQPTSMWQGDKFCLQVSGISTTDQQSVKDSGKGDSDFNDSDSDISGGDGGGKKNFSTFQPRLKSAANNLSGDCQATYCAILPHSFRAPADSDYRLHFSTAPPPPASVFDGLQTWKEAGYGTNHRPKSRNGEQSFSRTRTLPAYLPPQQQQLQQPGGGGGGAGGGGAAHKHSPNIVTVATALEVATIF